MGVFRRGVRRMVNAFGYDIARLKSTLPKVQGRPDVSRSDIEILERIAPFTMTSIERQLALVDAVRYLARNRIAGCFVECGVWRGGSVMAAALALLQENDASRRLYLFDTFEGMTEPTAIDRDSAGTPAVVEYGVKEDWFAVSEDEVRFNVASTGYDPTLLRFVKGPVEQTIPTHSPTEPVSLLRLDTDWYESTKHELRHLFPKLRKGGVLIVDDYGYWEGSKRAVDEYFASMERGYYLHRIDHTGRLLIKY